MAGGIERLDKRVLWVWRVRALLAVAFSATAASLSGSPEQQLRSSTPPPLPG
ncbi:MAG: hypothetical protein M3P34_06500 [Actinomycetota bacterium]|nr:hypothetical protein [Actinomycetota bacterium]